MIDNYMRDIPKYASKNKLMFLLRTSKLMFMNHDPKLSYHLAG